MAFELSRFGIGMKIVSPGGMKTDFFTRSLDTGRHAAYAKLVDRVMGVITDPKQMETYSFPIRLLRWYTKPRPMVKISFVMLRAKMQKQPMPCACS